MLIKAKTGTTTCWFRISLTLIAWYAPSWYGKSVSMWFKRDCSKEALLPAGNLHYLSGTPQLLPNTNNSRSTTRKLILETDIFTAESSPRKHSKFLHSFRNRSILSSACTFVLRFSLADCLDDCEGRELRQTFMSVCVLLLRYNLLDQTTKSSTDWRDAAS